MSKKIYVNTYYRIPPKYKHINENIRTILEKDNLKLFKENIDEIKKKTEKYKIFSYIYTKCATLKTSNILNYLIENSEIVYEDLCYIVQTLRVKKDYGKKYFKIILNKLNLSGEQKGKLMNRLAYYKHYDILHQLKYPPYDTNNFLKHIKNSDYINIYLPNKITNDTFIKYLQSPYCKLEKVKKYTRNHKILLSNKYNKRIKSLFRQANEDIINFILDMGYKPDKICFNNLLTTNYYDTILRLINSYKFTINKKRLRLLFNIPYRLQNKKKISGWRLRRRNQQHEEKSYLAYDNRTNFENYQQKMIKILEHVRDSAFKGIINKIWLRLILYLQYNLIEYMIKRYGNIFHLDKKYKKIIIEKYIKYGHLKNFKKLYQYDISEPSDITPDQCQYAITHEQYKLVDYFIDELSIYPKCLIPNRSWQIFRLSEEDILKRLEYAERIGYPVKKETEFIKLLFKYGYLKVIKYLIEKYKIKMVQKYLDNAIMNKKYRVANFYVKNKYPFYKKNMMYRILKNFSQWKFGSIDKRMINWIVKNGGGKLDINLFNNIFDKLVMRVNTETFKHLYYIYSGEIKIKNFKPYKNISIDKNIIMNWIDMIADGRYANCRDCKSIFEFFDEKNIYSLVPEDIKMINSFITAWEPDIGDIKYIVEKTNAQLDSSILTKVRTLDVFKYLESLNLILTEERFLTMMRRTSMEPDLVKYIKKKYKFNLTIKNLHNLINDNRFNLDLIMHNYKSYGIKPTLYTIELISNIIDEDNLMNIFIIVDQIKNVGKITPNTKATFDRFNNNNYLIRKIDKYEVVDYHPGPEEIPDNLNDYKKKINNNHDNDNDAFIERVLADEQNI